MSVPWGKIGGAIKGGISKIFGSPAIPAIASVAGAVIDRNAQRDANAANAQNVRDQMEFQREQSSTQYQRAVKDIGAAGLNPALAYGQGGNASESGAAARAEPVNGFLGRAVDAYQAIATGSAQRDLIRQQAAATGAQAVKTNAEAAILNPDVELAMEGRKGDGSPGYRASYQAARRMEMNARHFTASKTEEQFGANIRATNQGANTAKSLEDLQRTMATLNEQQFMNVWFRKNIAPYINSTAKTVSPIKGW